MVLNFYKYQGTGNDFIIIDIRNLKYNFQKQHFEKLCDRKFGIGADGVMLINSHFEHDFHMQFYNPDGSKSFCGNGSRCAVLYCFHQGLCRRKTSFLTNDGAHHAEILNSKDVKVNITSPIQVNELKNGDFKVNTGSPHYIKFTNELLNENFLSKCREIRYSEDYKDEGINVNFVVEKGKGIQVRTYERGVENETLSCGSGVTAAALSFAFLNNLKNIINVNTKGGDLKVEYKLINMAFENVYLIGPAHYVYRGEFDL